VPGVLGTLLCQIVRDVVLWADSPTDARAQLFAPGAALPELDGYQGIRGSLLTIERQLRGGPADAADLSHACQHVSEWAADRGWYWTGLLFAQAAAHVRPTMPMEAVRAGQHARRAAEYVLAQAWLDRGLDLAMAADDWTAYTLALSAIGNLHAQRGNFPRAREVHQKCLASATRHGLTDLQGDAYHDLMGIAIETGALDEAWRHGVAAFRAYGARHTKLLRLAHDFAYLLTLLQHYRSAIAIQHALLVHYRRPVDQIVVWGDLARASGETGNRALFDQAHAAVWDIISEHRPEDYMARALLDVAVGASSLREWTRAAEAATLALDLARERREGKIYLSAEQLLAALDAACGREREVRTTPAPVGADPSQQLAGEFVEALNYVAAGR
jgi:tetratricopeptide (TPR) repeat protein